MKTSLAKKTKTAGSLNTDGFRIFGTSRRQICQLTVAGRWPLAAGFANNFEFWKFGTNLALFN